jgi:cysteine desulfurase family protein
MSKRVIYADCAATSWPKPPEVLAAMAGYLADTGGNPGRSGHRLSIAAARTVYEAREAIAELFAAPDPLRVVFTKNVTEALNLTIYGMLAPGDHVVTTSMEHNSVTRPLRALEREGLRLDVVGCDAVGRVDLEAMRAAVTPGTRLVVVNHASNVCGTIQPLSEIAAIAHKAGALLLADTAQTAGVVPIDQGAAGSDLLAFTGHKGLLGPTGTGGLVLGEGVDASHIRPLMRGGTGSYSEYKEQPEALPDAFESGTVNGVGIAGLGASVRWLFARGVKSVEAHERMMTAYLLEGLSAVSGITLFGPMDVARRTAVVSLRLAGKSESAIGLALDDDYGILSRVGLHCSPTAHRTLGTFPNGTVRFSLGPIPRGRMCAPSSRRWRNWQVRDEQPWCGAFSHKFRGDARRSASWQGWVDGEAHPHTAGAIERLRCGAAFRLG